MSNAQGFTLVELMVALVLGLLLTAAAVQLLITGTLTFSNQRNAADVQDNATFGLSLVSQQLRRTNSGNAQIIGSTGSLNGLIFDAASASPTAPSNMPITAMDVNIASTVDLKSDQLVIQYQAAQVGMRDCEGNDIVSGDLVIERYFLRADSLSTESPKPLALACAAFRTNALTNASTSAGSIILNRVEDLRILLGTTLTVVDPVTMISTTTWRYDPINTYNALPTPRPIIRTVQLGVLIRSTNTDPATAAIFRSPNYKLLDQSVSVVKNDDGFIRRVFSTTVSFRNSLGAGV
jgi:type IV pilus assembly protein PilW